MAPVLSCPASAPQLLGAGHLCPKASSQHLSGDRGCPALTCPCRAPDCGHGTRSLTVCVLPQVQGARAHHTNQGAARPASPRWSQAGFRPNRPSLAHVPLPASAGSTLRPVVSRHMQPRPAWAASAPLSHAAGPLCLSEVRLPSFNVPPCHLQLGHASVGSLCRRPWRPWPASL